MPPTCGIDALALAGTDVLFSVDVPSRIGALAVGPSDVLRWSGNQVSVRHSAAALGIPDGLNLSGLERLPGGDLLVSFDTAGHVGGVAFKAGEILGYSFSTSRWSLRRSQARFGVRCAPCRPRDFSASVDPDVLFRSGMELYEQ